MHRPGQADWLVVLVALAALGAAACGGDDDPRQPVVQAKTTPCATDVQCAAGQVCTGGVCSCAGNNDCSGGDACVDGRCACTADTWDNYAGAFFADHCARCHSFARTYGGVASRQLSIQQRVVSRRMPPDNQLEQADIDRVDRWLSCGMPQ